MEHQVAEVVPVNPRLPIASNGVYCSNRAHSLHLLVFREFGDVLVDFGDPAVRFIERFEDRVQIFLRRDVLSDVRELVEHAELQAGQALTGPAVRDDLSGQHFEKRRFAASVRPDQADVVW